MIGHLNLIFFGCSTNLNITDEAVWQNDADGVPPWAALSDTTYFSVYVFFIGPHG